LIIILPLKEECILFVTHSETKQTAQQCWFVLGVSQSGGATGSVILLPPAAFKLISEGIDFVYSTYTSWHQCEPSEALNNHKSSCHHLDLPSS
jgi:hypothetical protein